MEEDQKITPKISFPIKEITLSSEINSLDTLEYVRVGAFNRPANTVFDYNYGFFGEKFSVNGEMYFTLLDAIPNLDSQKITLTSNLYQLSQNPGFHIYNKDQKRRSMCNKDSSDLEDVIDEHVEIFKNEIISDNKILHNKLKQ